MRHVILFLSITSLLAACSKYDSNDPADGECSTVADCNPGLTCGDLVPCVDGVCQRGQTINLPCGEGCRTDADCPDGMFCRIAPDDGNECVADGACMDVFECDGLPHDACPGAFECNGGVCEWVCQQNDDCQADSDCVKVPGDCCGCEWGGLEASVSASSKVEYLEELEQLCSVIDLHCGSHSACTDRSPICQAGVCRLMGDDCDCPSDIYDWNPVCAGFSGIPDQLTMPNPCVADCLEFPVWEYGRCDCRVLCYVEDPVCTEKGVTYTCGHEEAECNGQTVVYPAPCSEACNTCLMIAAPWRPVCGTDFRNYDDACFVDCQDDLDWWHTGACLDGEGVSCGTVMGTPCIDPEALFCLPNDPNGGGFCIKRGSCQTPQQCQDQDLDHIECVGDWTCPNHECTWECS